MAGGDSGFEKARFENLDHGKDGGKPQFFYFQFNPKQFSVKDAAEWDDSKSFQDKTPPQFKKASLSTADMDLIFDTTDTGKSVNEEFLDRLRSLLTPMDDELKDEEQSGAASKRPPKLKFKWGKFEMPCFISSMDITYLMFKPDGTPLRATVKLSIKETVLHEVGGETMQAIMLQPNPSMFVKEAEDVEGEESKLEHTENVSNAEPSKYTHVHQTQPDDTITGIAKKFDVPWQDICLANNITDPMELVPGVLLIVPTLPGLASVFEHANDSESPADWGEVDPQLNENSALSDMFGEGPGDFVFSESELLELGADFGFAGHDDEEEEEKEYDFSDTYTSNQEANVFEHGESAEAAFDWGDFVPFEHEDDAESEEESGDEAASGDAEESGDQGGTEER